MKKIAAMGWIGLVLTVSALDLPAQCGPAGAPVNELGIRLASLTNASNFGGKYVREQSANLGFLSGIHYKRYGAWGAFRTSMGVTRYDYQERRGCPSCQTANGKVSGVTLRAGYEWFAVMGPLEPYVGLDAMAVFGNYTGTTYGTNGTNDSEFSENRSRRGMGISSVAGLRFFLNYAVSVSAEASLDMLYLERRTIISQISPEPSTVARQGNYFDTVLHPLNWLSLNVMF